MQRRGLLGILGTSVFAPAIARAQSQRPVIGYLSGRSLATDGHLLAAVRAGLKEQGFVDGQNLAMEFRWADGNYERVEALATDLVKQKPDLIIAVGGTPVPIAAGKAAGNIPIVFTIGIDPVSLGLVANLNRPGGSMTGAMLLANSLEGKRIDLSREMVPGLRSIALLANPTSSFISTTESDARATTAALGLRLDLYKAATGADLDTAFADMARNRPDALAVATDGFLISRRSQIIALAARHGIPAIYPTREFTDDGGLASYAARWTDMYRWAGVYAGRILKGTRPADLPIQQPTAYELVVNTKTAKALGFTLPPIFLARADETIE